jgi:hypothetical protein
VLSAKSVLAVYALALSVGVPGVIAEASFKNITVVCSALSYPRGRFQFTVAVVWELAVNARLTSGDGVPTVSVLAVAVAPAE